MGQVNSTQNTANALQRQLRSPNQWQDPSLAQRDAQILLALCVHQRSQKTAHTFIWGGGSPYLKI